MTRQSFLITISCAVLGLALLAIFFAGLIRYQYRWYSNAGLPPGMDREENSRKFISEMSELVQTMDQERVWYAHFTDLQVNSYLEEEFLQSGLAASLMPEGITQPRVFFDAERIHAAFRYGAGLLSTVITIDLRVWLAPQEQNAVVLELEGFHAGALPISARSLLEQVSEVGRSNGIGVSWYRDLNTGHPVAVLRFQEDQQRAKWVLDALQLDAGAITITGRSDDHPAKSNVRAAANLDLQPSTN